jgi:plastocyanin
MSKKLIIIIIIITLIVIAGVVYYSLQPMGVKKGSISPYGQTSDYGIGAISQKPNITIKNFTFIPGLLIIKAGDTVTWTNNDSTAHKIKSDTFNSAVLNPGDTFKNTFSTHGTYNYSCAIHPSMIGQIIVQ